MALIFSALIYILKIIPLKYDFSRLLSIWDLLKLRASGKYLTCLILVVAPLFCFCSASPALSNEYLEQCSALFGKWLMLFLMKTSWLCRLVSSNTGSLAMWAKGPSSCASWPVLGSGERGALLPEKGLIHCIWAFASLSWMQPLPHEHG